MTALAYILVGFIFGFSAAVLLWAWLSYDDSADDFWNE